MAPIELVDADPRELLVDVNIRADQRPDADLVESVRELGVVVPIKGVRLDDGRIRVRDGHRRTLAAIEAGVEAVTVVVAGGDGSAVERIIEQYAANMLREAITAADEANAVQGLLDLGMTADQVARSTRMPRKRVDAAAAVAGSKVASGYIEQWPDLDLEQLSVVAEFDDDQEAVAQLAESARRGEGHFAHAVEQAHDARMVRDAVAVRRAELEAEGVKVIEDRPNYGSGWSLYDWADDQGQMMGPGNHAGCAYRGIYITGWAREDHVDLHEDEYCTDGKAAGHKRYTSAGNPVAEQTTEERRRIREGNAAWRTSTKVRQAWIGERLAVRKTPPAGGLRFVLESVAAGSARLRRVMEGGHKSARDYLGISGGDRPQYGGWSADPVVEAINSVGEQRAVVFAMVLILAAGEERLSDRAWDHPYREDAAHLRACERFGYTLSDVEVAALAKFDQAQADQAAAREQDAADVAARDKAGSDVED